jgi:hypothetical protein
LKAHGHHAGPAKAVAVALASRLTNASGRAIGQHYGIGSSAIGAIHRRLADRPEALEAVESLVRQVKKRTKYIVLQQDFLARGFMLAYVVSKYY